MKIKERLNNISAIAPEPTIWALRKNPRAGYTSASNDYTLYEHLFGYDPIKLVKRHEAGDADRRSSAENPNLNILNAGTNFAVREIASEGDSF